VCHSCGLHGIAHTEKYRWVRVSSIGFLNDSLQSVSSELLEPVVLVHRGVGVCEVAAQSDLLHRQVRGRRSARVVRVFRVQVELDLLPKVHVRGARVQRDRGVVMRVLDPAIVRAATRDEPAIVVVHN